MELSFIHADKVSLAYSSGPVLTEVSFAVAAGECFGIIGPNGSGKSTLLKLISGVLKPSSGEVRLAGKPAHLYPRKQLARWMAVLQQDALPPIDFTVREVIEMGRFPFQSWLGNEERLHAEELIDRIVERLQLKELQHRSVSLLSGGERQRVALGKVMAQEPKLLLLDEPTTYLDIGYQVQMMEWIRLWQQEAELTVVAVLHDLNLAAQYCSRLFMLQEGRAVGIGKPEEVIRAELLERVYGTQPIILEHPVSGVPQLLLQGGNKGS